MANVRELAGPWSSKFFIFHRPKTRENISSIVVRLPDGAPDQPGSYWAFSLQPLFGNCQLEYITDLQKLSSDSNMRRSIPWWAILVAVPFLILFRWRIYRAAPGLVELS